MANDQSFDPAHSGTEKDVAYFTHGLTVDAFDLSIRQVADDSPDNRHAKVELVFFQDKGNRKRESVGAFRMQLYELDQLVALIEQKKQEFLS